MRVLIIDDDFFITTALKTILESDSGIQVCGSGKNGKEAVTLYDSLRPDILLMDIRMEETGWLRRQRSLPLIPRRRSSC